MINQFIPRVYAVIIHEHKILISKEEFRGKQVTKFPGGGIELGEGVFDALKREIKEELNCEVTNHQIFHIPDQCIHSAFRDTDQILPIYYRCTLSQYQFSNCEHEVEWIPITKKGETIGFTFLQDLQVFELLQKQFI